MKCNDCDSPMVASTMARGGTRYSCVRCPRTFTVKPSKKPKEPNAAEPLTDDQPSWWATR